MTSFYTGSLTVTAAGAWQFGGRMQFYDEYDFNPSTHRSPGSESLVSSARKYIKGTPMAVIGAEFDVSQTSQDSNAKWEGDNPQRQYVKY